ncbi:MAG: ABC transporter permease [Uliginosibacterium sp.]|nr:ABC transporter permease [Uliginosibacterium sp.]
MQWLKFAFLNTLRNRRRSVVTLTIAAMGTAAMLLAAGFAEFTYESLSESAARNAGHLIVARSEFVEKEEDVPMQYGIQNYAALRKTLLADAEVRYLLPHIQFSGLISNGDKSVVMMGTGIDPDSEFLVKGPFLKITAGGVLSSTRTGAPQVMLGEGLAKSLNAHPGSSLTLLASTSENSLNAVDVEVKGIFSTGIPDYDKRSIYTDIDTAQKVLLSDRISQVGIYLASMELSDTARPRIEKLAGNGFTVQNWQDKAFFYRSVRDLYNRIFGGLGGIIALIVLFVIGNAMSMAVIERTREIGTLRALGTAPAQLTRVFSMEGAILGGLGAVLGGASALLISIFLIFAGIQMPPAPGYSTGYPLQVAINPIIYLIVIALIVALSTLCAMLVSRRSARKPIVEALGHV